MREDIKIKCIKYEKMLPSFFHNRLDMKEKMFIKEHSKTCYVCKQKFLFMKNIYKDFNRLKTDYIKQNPAEKIIYTINEYNNFEENLSAYIDNELTLKESLKIKEFIIRNPNAKTKFRENVMLQKLLNREFSLYRQKINMREELRNLIFRITNFHIGS